ncbi:MAG TPA: NADPH-dependent FMN reductase [Atopostipes sp.]|nr:NADPH-dependent FMN reductase [Atopostipes sp.]
MTKVGVVVGSIREGSFSGRVAKALVGLLPEDYEATYLQIDHLPLYSQDSDENPPQVYQDFRDDVEALDALIFVTPEHNRSVPAALKNALDIASRPYGANKWGGKPALIASQSPGAISGFGANHHLRQMLTFLDVPVVQQPEVYLAQTPELFGENGEFLKEGTEVFLQAAVDKFVDLVNRYKA